MDFLQRLSKDGTSLQTFLVKQSLAGVQVKNRFEVYFNGATSIGLPDVTWQAVSITVPQTQASFVELNYDGTKFAVPTGYDCSHTFEMTLLNDAASRLYIALREFLMRGAYDTSVDNDYMMEVKALPGSVIYHGSRMNMYGVQLESVGSLDFGYSDNDVQTFTTSWRCAMFNVREYTYGTMSNIPDSIFTQVF